MSTGSFYDSLRKPCIVIINSRNNLAFEQELEAWILSYLATAKTYAAVNPATVIRMAPQSLILNINSEQELESFLFDMERRGLVLRHSYSNFQITNNGYLYFRKFLHPLVAIAQDEKRYSTIIDKTEGTDDTKKKFKKFLKSIKGKLPDQASDEIMDFLKGAGKEAIFYAIRLVIESHPSHH